MIWHKYTISYMEVDEETNETSIRSEERCFAEKLSPIEEKEWHATYLGEVVEEVNPIGDEYNNLMQ